MLSLKGLKDFYKLKKDFYYKPYASQTYYYKKNINLFEYLEFKKKYKNSFIDLFSIEEIESLIANDIKRRHKIFREAMNKASIYVHINNLTDKYLGTEIESVIIKDNYIKINYSNKEAKSEFAEYYNAIVHTIDLKYANIDKIPKNLKVLKNYVYDFSETYFNQIY